MLGIMYVGRKVGWQASLHVFYRISGARFISLLIAWGLAVAGLVRFSIDLGAPGVLVRWISGCALGAYVAVPNYGLFAETTLPSADLQRHRLVSGTPLLTYFAASAMAARRELAPIGEEIAGRHNRVLLYLHQARNDPKTRSVIAGLSRRSTKDR